MSVMIRLVRAGANNKPFFHVVAATKARARNGKYLERLGTYNPKAKTDAEKLNVNMEALQKWIAKGAQVSETIGHFLKSVAKSK